MAYGTTTGALFPHQPYRNGNAPQDRTPLHQALSALAHRLNSVTVARVPEQNVRKLAMYLMSAVDVIDTMVAEETPAGSATPLPSLNSKLTIYPQLKSTLQRDEPNPIGGISRDTLTQAIYADIENRYRGQGEAKISEVKQLATTLIQIVGSHL